MWRDGAIGEQGTGKWEEKGTVGTWRRTILLCMLALGAYQDCRERQIHMLLPVLAGGAGLLLWSESRDYTALELAGGIGIGVVLLFAARFSQEQIGMGDGAILVVSGIFLGFWGNLLLLLTALLLAAISALYLITIRKKGRGYRMPFVPFLLAAYLLLLV